MESILGLIMLYTWVHSIVIVYKKTKDLTQYETGVMILGLVSITLFIIGATA